MPEHFGCQCEEFESMGVIEQTCHSGQHQLYPYKKLTREITMCSEYQWLNAQIITDRSPTPCLTECLHNLHGKCYFTALDLIRDIIKCRLLQRADSIQHISQERFSTSSNASVSG